VDVFTPIFRSLTVSIMLGLVPRPSCRGQPRVDRKGGVTSVPGTAELGREARIGAGVEGDEAVHR
jgi:hypothetical protein